jgi:glutamate synthase (NADPH/NADH) large chain
VNRLRLAELPRRGEAADDQEKVRLQSAFGYTAEEMRLIVAPLARDGAEPVARWAMTPRGGALAPAEILPAYFRQQFAQVTNPPSTRSVRRW